MFSVEGPGAVIMSYSTREDQFVLGVGCFKYGTQASCVFFGVECVFVSKTKLIEE